MQIGHLRQSLRVAGAALALAAVTVTMLAPGARADLPPLGPLQALTAAPSLPTGMPSANPSLPSGAPSTNALLGIQGILPSVPSGYAPLPNLHQNPKFFHYYDHFRGWGIMRVDYVKLNWHTDSKLIHVTLYHKVYVPWGYYWVDSKGSGCENDGLFAFSLDREGDGLNQLFFEGKVYKWSTYHPVGQPHAPRWFWIQPY